MIAARTEHVTRASFGDFKKRGPENSIHSGNVLLFLSTSAYQSSLTAQPSGPQLPSLGFSEAVPQSLAGEPYPTPNDVWNSGDGV